MSNTLLYRSHSHRLILSALYDWLVLLGLIFIAAFVAVAVNKLITGQESLEQDAIMQLWLTFVVASYFGYFWKRWGQTVGMRAWRIMLVSQDNQPLTIKQIALRLISAIPAYGLLLIGVFWQYIDPHNLNWHDRASGTVMKFIPKSNKQTN